MTRVFLTIGLLVSILGSFACVQKGGNEATVATGDTIPAVEQEIRDAIRFHIDGLKADGLPVPQPTSIAEYVET